MTGKEDIKIGDKLKCMSNEGLMTMGKFYTVYGINKDDINVVNCNTSWVPRNSFRWENYQHILK